MTADSLASKIAKIEGKKSQVHIGDIREILGILSDIFFEESTQYNGGVLSPTLEVLYAHGKKRALKKKKKRKTK